jgi:leader peptidase (prepilin peptidase) / N-methyltransferase
VNWPRLALCVALSLPAGWFAGALYERIPSRRPLFHPFPQFHISGVSFTIQVFVTALFALASVRFDDGSFGVLFGYLIFFTVAVALSAIDLDTLRLPDRIVGGALVVSIPLITIASLREHAAEQIQYALIGGAFYFVFLLITHVAFPKGMGFGDVKLAALMGMYVGWLGTSLASAVSLVLYAMLVGFLGGSAVGMALFVVRRKSRQYPFGPFLVAGAIVVIAFSTFLVPQHL